MNKILLSLLLLVIIIVAVIYGPKAVRLYNLANLYDEDSIASNFINIDKIFTVSEPIPAAERPYSLIRRLMNFQKHIFLKARKRTCKRP